MRLRMLFYIVAWLLAGYAGTVTLQPTPSRESAAADTASGVRLVTTPSEWPGRAPISREVTPLKLRIDNNSNERVLIRYSGIRLVAPDGRIYTALPLYRIDASVRVPVLLTGYHPETIPGLTASGFALSPLYSPLYPSLPSAVSYFPNDTLYYGQFGQYWRSIELPTQDMLRLALPEGVLKPGGHAEGFVYFQRVAADVPSMRFRMDVPVAGKGNELGAIEIPPIVS